MTQLRGVEATGRLVIDLQAFIDGESAGIQTGDIELRDGDRLLIPKVSQEVTVIGESQQNASHLFKPGLSRDQYISMSGGFTRRADKKLVYVVRANGAVITQKRSRWFGRSKDVDIRPGDTIVVPIKVDKIPGLALWTGISQIVYQAAIAVAAVQNFD